MDPTLLGARRRHGHHYGRGTLAGMKVVPREINPEENREGLDGLVPILLGLYGPLNIPILATGKLCYSFFFSNEFEFNFVCRLWDSFLCYGEQHVKTRDKILTYTPRESFDFLQKKLNAETTSYTNSFLIGFIIHSTGGNRHLVLWTWPRTHGWEGHIG